MHLAKSCLNGLKYPKMGHSTSNVCFLPKKIPDAYIKVFTTQEQIMLAILNPIYTISTFKIYTSVGGQVFFILKNLHF